MTTQQKQSIDEEEQEQKEEQSIDEEEQEYLLACGPDYVKNYRKRHNIPSDKRLPAPKHFREFLSLHCWKFATYKRIYYNYILFVKQFYPKYHYYDLEKFFEIVSTFYSEPKYDDGLRKIKQEYVIRFMNIRQKVKNIEEKLAFKTLTEEEVRGVCLDEYM